MGHLGQDIKDDPNRIIDFMLLFNFVLGGNMLWNTILKVALITLLVVGSQP